MTEKFDAFANWLQENQFQIEEDVIDDYVHETSLEYGKSEVELTVEEALKILESSLATSIKPKDELGYGPAFSAYVHPDRKYVYIIEFDPEKFISVNALYAKLKYNV
jgi:hypothetical protein